LHEGRIFEFSIERFFQRKIDRVAQNRLVMPEHLRGEPVDSLQARRHGLPTLAEVIRQHAVPIRLFRDLLDAFAQDVVRKSYADWPEPFDHYHRSANPAGRLVLYLFGRTEPEHLAQSDCICTALQPINFWQAVVVDWKKECIYIPQADLPRFRFSEGDFAASRWSANWAALMDFQNDRARDCCCAARRCSMPRPTDSVGNLA